MPKFRVTCIVETHQVYEIEAEDVYAVKVAILDGGLGESTAVYTVSDRPIEIREIEEGDDD